MGCTQSKIENEEAVSRCKDRKQFMKDAVATRNAFAAAHSGYTMALKNTGAALSDYAQGEVHDHRPSTHLPPAPVQAPYETLPPPPPLPNFSPAPTPLKRATTMPEFSSHHHPEMPPATEPIQEEENEVGVEDDEEEDEDHRQGHENEPENAGPELTLRRSRGGKNDAAAEAAVPQSPPLPRTPPMERMDRTPPPPPPNGGIGWDYFFAMDEHVATVDIRPDDNDASDGGGGGYGVNGFKGSENVGGEGDGGGVINGRDDSGGDRNVEPKTPEKVIEPETTVRPVKKLPKQMLHSNTAPPEIKRVGKVAGANVNLLQTFSDLDDHFLKASESAHEVSKMLEATRLHYHSNFADNRGHIDHSARVMRVITWNRSFRGMPNADDGKDDFDAEEFETHATVLDKLLAWEKKLYDEVKAGELMKLEYKRKVALLNKQKKRGTNTEAIEKTKAAVSHLHTRYIVDMQSMDSTVSEINRLRDHQLYPKLVALVNGMAAMWEAMHMHHDTQLKIVFNLRYLDVSQGPTETTAHHHERTAQLCGVVQEWHSQFQKLVDHQKEYIQALNGWLKLNLIPIESSLKEKVSSPPRVSAPPIQALLHAWHENLEKLPAELARNAIFSFAGVMKTILTLQQDEVKLKEKCEETSREFTRKNRAFEDWYHKYMQRRTPPDEMDGERTEDANHKDPVAERRFVVESLKKRLEEEIEAHQKHCKQVREKSLTSMKTHLPELFRAMSDFALACSDMYKNLQSISIPQQPRNPPESSNPS